MLQHFQLQRWLPARFGEWPLCLSAQRRNHADTGRAFTIAHSQPRLISEKTRYTA